jgi:hypothetical protein
MAQLNNYEEETWVARLELVSASNYEIYTAAIYWAM